MNWQVQTLKSRIDIAPTAPCSMSQCDPFKSSGKEQILSDKQFIALEIHDASFWEPARVWPIVAKMERWGYNALVLHQNELLDSCTQLGLTANYGVSDLRLKKVRNRTAWLNALADRLEGFGAKLFIEIKEPSFEDYALELFPDLCGADGIPDLNHPCWPEFCQAKTEDILNRTPKLGGFIVNLSSPESRVSMQDLEATGDAEIDKSNWFDRMITAFHAPLVSRGKALYVRDFSYTSTLQSDVLSAVSRCGDTIGASVKATAHDYFPRSPENPVLRNFPGETIVEFDTFGEHTGWSIIPNCRVAEFAQRMETYRDIGASGVLVRTSWEAIAGVNALDSLSAVNVFALPKFVRSDVDPSDVILTWLKQEFDVEGDIAQSATELLLQSWEIPAAAYWNDEVFPRHSCLPSTWQEGWMSMETTGMGRRDHSVSIAEDDPRLTEDARQALFKEKEEASALALKLARAADDLSPSLPQELADLFQTFAWLPQFARQFELASKAAFYAARGTDQQKLVALRGALLALADDIEGLLADATGLPYHHKVLLDSGQIRRFASSLIDAE